MIMNVIEMDLKGLDINFIMRVADPDISGGKGCGSEYSRGKRLRNRIYQGENVADLNISGGKGCVSGYIRGKRLRIRMY